MSTANATDATRVADVPLDLLEILYEAVTRTLMYAMADIDNNESHRFDDRDELTAELSEITRLEAIREELLTARQHTGSISRTVLEAFGWKAIAEATEEAFGHNDYVPEHRPTMRQTARLMLTIAEARDWLPTVGMPEPVEVGA